MREIESTEAHCEKHGAYRRKKLLFMGKEIVVGCQQCTAEKNREQAQAVERARRLEQRGYNIDQSNIPPRFQQKALADFTAQTADQRKALDIVTAYLKDWPQHKTRGEGLIFLGRPGTGKTHLACAIGMELCNRGEYVLYQKTADIMRRIKDTYSRNSKETETGIYRQLLDYDLLIIDEVGRQVGSEAEKLMLFEIINGRYEHCKPIVLISNGTFAELREYITEAGFDRLKEIGKSVIFSGESMRGRV